jgi:hypothetical protein
MSEAKSDSPTKCGLCGARAHAPGRFTGEDIEGLDGVFNVCSECGAECSGTDAYNVKDRWFWTGAKAVAQQREAMEASEIDAERHAARFDD